jgi:VWFA-related protein
MFLGGILLTAQELQHDVTVTLKLIQVYVTDDAGNPVTDLKPAEFIIYDNRKRQDVTEFERHMLFPSEAEVLSPPEKKDIARAGAQDDVMNRKFFLFFDLINNNSKGFQKSQEAALHFIDNQLQPSDEVGVLSYSVLKQLTLHEYLTKDHQAVRNVVAQIGGLGRVGRAENFEALLWREMTGEQTLDVSKWSQPVKEGVPAHLRNVGELPGSLLGEGAISRVRFDREQYKNLINNMFERLAGLSKALRYISGHKHIVLFSSGVPYSLIHGLETNSPTTFTSLGMDAMLRDRYEEMLKELSNSNTTVFSLNTEGLATNMNLPSHQKGEATLRSISKYTGGKFVGNVQNYAQVLDTIQTFTGSYYVLGYYIDQSWDGRK